MAIEELKYALIAKDDNFEIRQYAPFLVAETTVTGNFEWVGNVAFRRLAGYIFGKNRRQDSLAMTAPVTQAPEPEKIAMTAPVLQAPDQEQIAMTAPVTQTGEGKSYVFAFVMPSAYTLDKLPEPLDLNVKLSRRQGQLMAALTYSGTWRKSTYEQKKKQLVGLIERHGYVVVGPAVFARYDPPFTLWFRRRNEVLIPVKPASETSDE